MLENACASAQQSAATAAVDEKRIVMVCEGLWLSLEGVDGGFVRFDSMRASFTCGRCLSSNQESTSTCCCCGATCCAAIASVRQVPLGPQTRPICKARHIRSPVSSKLADFSGFQRARKSRILDGRAPLRKRQLDTIVTNDKKEYFNSIRFENININSLSSTQSTGTTFAFSRFSLFIKPAQKPNSHHHIAPKCSRARAPRRTSSTPRPRSGRTPTQSKKSATTPMPALTT